MYCFCLVVVDLENIPVQEESGKWWVLGEYRNVLGEWRGVIFVPISFTFPAAPGACHVSLINILSHKL